MIVRTFRIMPKNLEKRLVELKIWGRIEIDWITALLRLARIVRSILESYYLNISKNLQLLLLRKTCNRMIIIIIPIKHKDFPIIHIQKILPASLSLSLSIYIYIYIVLVTWGDLLSHRLQWKENHHLLLVRKTWNGMIVIIIPIRLKDELIIHTYKIFSLSLFLSPYIYIYIYIYIYYIHQFCADRVLFSKLTKSYDQWRWMARKSQMNPCCQYTLMMMMTMMIYCAVEFWNSSKEFIWFLLNIGYYLCCFPARGCLLKIELLLKIAF